MEYILKTPRIILDIYPKNEQASTLINPNDNSEFVEIVKSIVDKNPELVNCELTLFLERIEIVLQKYLEELKSELLVYLSDNLVGKSAWDEFNEYHNLSLIHKFKEFANKYNLETKQTDLIGKIFSIGSVKDYIKQTIGIEKIELKSISVLELDM